MKKIKISELPLHDSLKGLHTIGTDSNNRSVKVSLEFVENTTEGACKRANDAAAAALTAKTQTETATEQCCNIATATNTAKTLTERATTAANAAAANANQKANQANDSAQRADAARQDCEKASSDSEIATRDSVSATANAIAATKRANDAAAAALTVKLDITEMLQRIVPATLSVSCPDRLTVGNPNASVTAVLTPSTALQNVIFLSDDRAVEVDILTGRLNPYRVGKSRIRVVPTCNVELTKTILIEVGNPTTRLIDKREFHLTADGSLRLT